MDDLAVLYAVKFDTQGLDAPGIQLASGEPKVGELDMSLAVHQEVLGHEVEYGGLYLIMTKRTSGLRSRWIYPSR